MPVADQANGFMSSPTTPLSAATLRFFSAAGVRPTYSAHHERKSRDTDLRQADIETWIEAIVPLFVNEIVDRQIGNDGQFETKIVQRVPDSDAVYTKAAKLVVQKTRRAARRKMTPDLLQRVANAYRSDEARPAHAVEKTFIVTARTAYRNIEEARKQGFLEATGEQAKNSPSTTGRKSEQ